MIGRLNLDLSKQVIARNDHLSETPEVIKSLIVSFLQEIDSARFKEVSCNWVCFYEKKANEHSRRVQSLLQQVPSLIFRKQLYNSEISLILYVSQKALVLLEIDGVFCSLNRKDWRNIAPGSLDSEPCRAVQTVFQMGHITFAQKPSIYTVRLEDNTIVNKSPLTERSLPGGPRLYCRAVIHSRNNEQFFVYIYNIGYLDAGHFDFLDNGISCESRVIKKSVLQGNWLSVIFCANKLSKNTKIRLYNALSKQRVFEETGEFYHTKNRLIVNNSENIRVFDMDSLDPEWPQNPVWEGTIENGNGKVVISACNDQYLVLRTFSSNQDEIFKKVMTGVAWHSSVLKVFFKYIMLDLIDGSQESFTRQTSAVSESESAFLVQNFLFLYLNGKLDVIDLRLKQLIATNLEIPGFCVILDAKILENELLIYFTTNDHVHCMLQFALKDKEIPLAVEEVSIKEKIEKAIDTPIAEDPPRELPIAAPVVPSIPRVAAADALLPPPLPPVENAPSFLSSLWSKLSSCFSILAGFCSRIINFFRK